LETAGKTFFALRAPCANCPFRREGAIALEAGHLERIKSFLLENDGRTFHCHKTAHHDRTGGTWDDAGQYRPGGRESMCAGAMARLEKAGRPSIAMRLGQVMGLYDPARLQPSFADVIDPPLAS